MLGTTSTQHRQVEWTDAEENCSLHAVRASPVTKICIMKLKHLIELLDFPRRHANIHHFKQSLWFGAPSGHDRFGAHAVINPSLCIQYTAAALCMMCTMHAALCLLVIGSDASQHGSTNSPDPQHHSPRLLSSPSSLRGIKYRSLLLRHCQTQFQSFSSAKSSCIFRLRFMITLRSGNRARKKSA